MEPHVQALNKAKIQLMSRPDSVFFTTLCFSLRHVWDDRISTAATDGKKILFNPKFFLSLNLEEQIFLILHETMHCAYLHMLRKGSRDPVIMNCAGDYVINLQLVDRGFKMPSMGLLDQQYRGMSTEQVYDLLIKNRPLKMDPKLLDLLPPDEDTEEQLEQDMSDILVRAQLQSQMAGEKPGAIPGDIQIFLNKLLNPKLPWNRILQKYLHAKSKDDYSWRKPNRRFFPKHYLPSLHSQKLIDIAVAVDTSGSVSDEDFLQFITETHSILRMMNPSKISFIQFDTQLQAVDEVRSVKELMGLKFTGRGGTNIFPVLEWARDNKPQLLLVFTDGQFHFYNDVYGGDTIWLIHDNPNFKASFGKIIHYEVSK